MSLSEYIVDLLGQSKIDIISVLVSVSLIGSSLIVFNLFKVIFGDRFTGKLPISHKVAVLGLPKSGKTTLITAIFELIQRGDTVDGARLHGVKTIKNVNQNIVRLNSGVKIGPTFESDAFVFRFSYLKRRSFVQLLYDVEIADFPGEYSQSISNVESNINAPADKYDDEFDYTLFSKEFFSWIATSREYLILIDLSAIYGSANASMAIADISGRVRTSWQVIEDAISERGVGDAKNRRVSLVFTKFDALDVVLQGPINISNLMDESLADAINETQEHNDLKRIRSDITRSGERQDLRFRSYDEIQTFDRVFS